MEGATGARRRALKLGENAIGADGFWGLVRSPGASLAFLALLATIHFVAGFGGGSKPNCHLLSRRRAQRVGARRAEPRARTPQVARPCRLGPGPRP